MSLTANFMSQLILLTGATATSPAQRLSAAFYLMKLLPATESQSEIYSSLSPSHCLLGFLHQIPLQSLHCCHHFNGSC